MANLLNEPQEDDGWMKAVEDNLKTEKRIEALKKFVKDKPKDKRVKKAKSLLKQYGWEEGSY